MININSLNQNNDYQLGKPNVQKVFSNLLMRKSNTTSGDVGKIIPIFVQEMLPNQQINVMQSINVQFTPLVSNLLHQMNAEINHYFVPYRLIWDEWEKFITGGETGLEEPEIPNYTIEEVMLQLEKIKDKMKQKGYQVEIETETIFEKIRDRDPFASINIEKVKKDLDATILQTNWDYLGLPTAEYIANFLFLSEDLNTRNGELERKYLAEGIEQKNLDFFKNKENFKINKLNFRAINKIYNDWIRVMDWEPEKNIDDITTGIANWNWDYFTRARKYQLRGAMPTIPVKNTLIDFFAITTGGQAGAEELEINGATFKVGTTNTNRVIARLKPEAGFEFDDLMTAAALMNYYTANARLKPRYSEQLLARWGVRIQDARVQQAEYLGSEYLSITSQGIINTGDKQGQITGQIWGNGQAMQGRYRAQEHGVFISELVIKPANVYEQGVPALYKHKTKFDFATPEFVNLPDQPIKKSELDPLAGDEVLGYKSIYDEYRTTTNIVTGLLRPSIKAGLKTYTLARNVDIHSQGKNFGNIVKCIPEMERIKQYLDQPDFILIIMNEIQTVIPLPYQSNPEMAL